jgi:hypothetical protein
MTPSKPSGSQLPSSQPAGPAPEFALEWSSVQRLHSIYAELAREFVIEVPACAGVDETENPAPEAVEQARQWLDEIVEKIQVHQLRQFLQTSSLVDSDGLIGMLRHLLATTARTDALRDKIDFLLVQYFSQVAPTDLNDNLVDLEYVAHGLEAVLGTVELKSPVWLNALDRVLDSARRCHSLDELLHGGVLEQGRKAKGQAGDLFYMPIALAAFTRFGYLMRRVFFRLMLADLNDILDGLIELEEKGVETIDCRRAQFSAQEPIIRLRMICQSWKVMFQAEYSSGQPLRMLVDLRASVEAALGRDSAAVSDGKAVEVKSGVALRAAAAAAGASGSGTHSQPAASRKASSEAAHKQQAEQQAEPQAKPQTKPQTKFAVGQPDAAEFEISSASTEWKPDADS